MASIQKNNQKSTQSLSKQILNPFISIQKEVDKALHGFYDIFESKPFDLMNFENLHIAPAMDLVEDDKSFKIEAEMPGMDENDISLSIQDNMLTICGEKSTSKKNDESKNYISREISYGRYERSITLPQSANGDKATATFKKGILCITIPKKLGSNENGHQIKITKG